MSLKYLTNYDSFLNEKKISDEYKLFKIVSNFSYYEESSWYMQGGCYDFALAFGRIIKAFGKTPIYWSYGSEQEPHVHIAIQCDNHFYDASGQYKSIEAVSMNADIYTDTVCDWKIIEEKSVGGNNKNIESVYQHLLRILDEINKEDINETN